MPCYRFAVSEDDDRSASARRRLSDATKARVADLASGWSVDKPVGEETSARIADLASGWNVDTADTPEESPTIPAPEPQRPAAAVAPASTPAPRKKPRTMPPPAPGSSARKALDAAMVDAKPEPAVRLKPPTKPPPLPPGAKGGGRMRSGPTDTGTFGVSGAIGLTPAPTVVIPPRKPPAGADPALRGLPEPAEPSQLAVPIGEFDHGPTQLEQEKLRIAHEQQTLKRDPANA